MSLKHPEDVRATQIPTCLRLALLDEGNDSFIGQSGEFVITITHILTRVD